MFPLALIVTASTGAAQDAVRPSASPAPTEENAAAHERVVVSSTPLGGDLFELSQSVTLYTGDELELRLDAYIG